MINIEELKAQAEAAQAALQAAEQAEREAARAVKEAAERKEREAQAEIAAKKMAAAFAPVVTEFRSLTVQAGDFSLALKQGVTVAISREEAKTGSWVRRTSYTGRYIVEIARGGFGAERKASRYPTKQDGTFNLPKMLLKAQELIDMEEHVAAAKSSKQTAKQAAEVLAAELNARFETAVCRATYSSPSYGSSNRTTYTEHVAPAGKVYVGGSAYNPAQVEVYIKMMREINALATK